MSNSVLSMQGVSFAYNGEDVLSDVTLAIENGDFAAIVGPNGAGKSTLLKLAVGLLQPRCGEVFLRNTEGRPLSGKQIGYVSQNPAKISHAFPATVYELVSMGRTAAKGFFSLFNKADRHIVQHVLELVDMWTYRDRLIGELSGGQQQRVYVARALAANPELLVLDEPTTGIDTEGRDRLYALLATLNKNLRVTVLLVSHDIDRVLRHAKNVICINGGITFHGPVSQTAEIQSVLGANLLFTREQVHADV